MSEAVGNVGRMYWKPRVQRTVVFEEDLEEEEEEENERKKKKKGCDVYVFW